MRIRPTLVVAPLLWTCLSACEQAPDVVSHAVTVDAGPNPSAQPDPNEPMDETCDPSTTAIYGVLLGVLHEGCSFEVANTQVGRLVAQEILTPPLPQLDPEAIEPDELCIALRQRLGVAPARPDPEDLRRVVLCPDYCAALELWVEARKGNVAQCTPQDGP